ncbi:uncharacterized protein LOC142235790 [Haematobia irritans]|uniref:uncharacterized protein LOC142235790 n=1 Tax=Haematobia irritans TaxID=7368 RepID=UPI003F4FE489
MTFLIKCRNEGIIPGFIKQAMKNVYNILGNRRKEYEVQKTLDKHIENFQRKILNVVIKHQHNIKRDIEREKDGIKSYLDSKLNEEEKNYLWTRENKITREIKEKSTATHKKKLLKLQEQQREELDIKINEKWFINTTDTQFHENVKWLLSLGQKHGLPTSKAEFPLFKYISDGEHIIQSTKKEKEEQETARTMFATTLETHLNKMKYNSREKFVTRTVEQTRQFLKKNKNILILNADKGNTTVAMEKSEYQQRMMKIISDMMMYQRINKDPTTSLQRKNNELVEELDRNNMISPAEKKRLKMDVATAPRIYGLPKTHKDGYPLRPICSSIDSPSSNLCKYIGNLLKILTQDSKYNIKDSLQFKNKIKNLTIKEDEKLVSFDVVSLFQSVPVDLALKIIESRWQELEGHTRLTKNIFMKILKFCIVENRYFTYEDKTYKQKRGLPMGSSASPIVADIVMEHLLDNCMENLTTKPKILTKYVDDIFAVVREGAIHEILTTLNGFHNSIKFTIDFCRRKTLLG